MTATDEAIRRARPPTARIFDRGYRPYDGPRLGVRGAVRAA